MSENIVAQLLSRVLTLERSLERLKTKEGNYSDKSETLTIASDVITVGHRNFYLLLPQSGTSDDLSTISGSSDGRQIVLATKTAGHAITLKDGVGNLSLNADRVLDAVTEAILLQYDANAGKWLELAYNVAGSGSGLDADTLDGLDSTYFLPAASYTAADVLTKVKTVDGSGSGLDADLLDGLDSLYFLPAASYTAADVLAKILTVDGPTSGLDADLLDGLSSAAFATAVHTHVASDITDFNEAAQDAIGGAFLDTATIDLTYNDGTNQFSADVINDSITFAKLQNIATDSLVGRDTASTGDPETILLNATLSMDGSGNLQRAALTGDVTASAGSNATTIANDAVTFAKLQNIATDSLVGRDTAGSGDAESILLNATLSMDGAGNLQRAALTGDVTASAGSNATTIANDAVTFAKMQNIATDSLIGRDTAGTGDPESITLGASLEFGGSGTIQRAALTGDVTASANSNALTIANDAVTNAKLANMAAATVRGQIVGGSGDPVDLTATQLNAIVGTVALTVDAPIRTRQTGATRYRSEIGVTGVIAYHNAYDDTGGTYIPLYLDALEVRFRTGTTVSNASGIDSLGNMGVGTVSPQGKLHAYDGNGGFLFVSKTAIDGTAQVLIPNGAGDVVSVLRASFVWVASSGGASGGTVNILPGANNDIVSSSPDFLNLRVNADGSVDVRRTGGALTYTVIFSLLWR